MAVPQDPYPPFQDYAHPERLVTASWLSARLGVPGLKVVESDGDALLYDIGHIPGAVRIDWQQDLNDPTTRDFIDGAAFARLMREKGIERDDTVVIYGDKGNNWAAFTLWVFELFGHADVRLLDGGRDSWMGEERETSFMVPHYPRSSYPVVERADGPLRVFVDEVLDIVRAGSAALVDVRDERDYTGESVATLSPAEKNVQRGGHIPGARNASATAAVYPNGCFRSAAELRSIYQDLDPHQPTITYCQLGDLATLSWFVLRFLLGFDSVRAYDGSWSEWGNMVRMPIAAGSEPGDAAIPTKG